MESKKKLIDAQDAVRLLRGKCVAKYPNSFLLGLLAAASEIEGMPEAEPVKHGRWVKADNLKPKCSVCGEFHLYSWPDHKKCNYCPSCGAKMNLEENE